MLHAALVIANIKPAAFNVLFSTGFDNDTIRALLSESEVGDHEVERRP